MPGNQGSGGRNAKTISQHRLHGTFRKHRHSGFHSPNTPKGRPKPPKRLSGEARKEWKRLVARLELTGALSPVDDAVMYQYCQLFAETEGIALARSQCAASLVTIEAAIGTLQGKALIAALQEVSKLRELLARYGVQVRQGRMAQRQFLLEFGLTPASRGRVKLPEPGQPEDVFAEFDVPDSEPPSKH